MKPLIDADILLYEIGFSCQPKDMLLSWEKCEEMFDRKIELICDEVQATEPPTLYLTNTAYINKALNKRRVYNDEPVRDFIDNFRHSVSTTGYKAGRSSTKPFYFNSLIFYILSRYDVYIDENGLEADDAMCIEQFRNVKEGNYNTIICSRDKDVRQCPGWHYSWECGKQASIGPFLVDELGILKHLNPDERDAKGHKKPMKVFGTGNKFFYYQMLCGDACDTIKGAKGYGPSYSYHLLKDLETTKDCHEAATHTYKQIYGTQWELPFLENASLVWMVKELDKDGNIIKWKAVF